MKKLLFFCLLHILLSNRTPAQMPGDIRNVLSAGVNIKTGIAYAADTLAQHTLDIYMPEHISRPLPLLVWIHGGGWRVGDKYTDMDYMKTTLKAIIDDGFAVASIDYRYSTTAVFPAQAQDCNQAINYLYKNADRFHLDTGRFAIIGFSAGGQLASLLATSNNNNITDFFPLHQKPLFNIKAAIDFFGPADFIARIGGMPLDEGQQQSTSTTLLGAQPLVRPDLAKAASATTYVDHGDPPFLIFHGNKDQTVPITLSKLLDAYLKLADVPSEFVIVPGAPHAGPLFGSEAIKKKIIAFLNLNLK